MTSQPRRVVVAVQPRLLGDVLQRALEDMGFEVVRARDAGDVDPAEGAVVVILSGAEIGPPAEGQLIIHLPETGLLSDSSVITLDGETPAPFADVQEVLDLADVYSREHH